MLQLVKGRTLAALCLLAGLPVAAEHVLFNQSTRDLKLLVKSILVDGGTVQVNVFPGNRGPVSAWPVALLQETKGPSVRAEPLPSFTGIYNQDKEFSRATLVLAVPPGGTVVFATAFDGTASSRGGAVVHFDLECRKGQDEAKPIGESYRHSMAYKAFANPEKGPGEILEYWNNDFMDRGDWPLQVWPPGPKDPKTRVVDAPHEACCVLQ